MTSSKTIGCFIDRIIAYFPQHPTTGACHPSLAQRIQLAILYRSLTTLDKLLLRGNFTSDCASPHAVVITLPEELLSRQHCDSRTSGSWTSSFYHQYTFRHETPVKVRPKILAKQYLPRDSFKSCPDLAALHISAEQPQSSVITASADGHDAGVLTEPSRPSTPVLIHKPRKSRNIPSNTRQVSKGARGVLGKVRTFPKVAAAKMAHPTIKIDTSVQATKRGAPAGEEGLEVVDDQGNPALDEGDKDRVPPFLCQSVLGLFSWPVLRDSWLMGPYCRDPPEI